jgi:hypothetical protein
LIDNHYTGYNVKASPVKFVSYKVDRQPLDSRVIYKNDSTGAGQPLPMGQTNHHGFCHIQRLVQRFPVTGTIVLFISYSRQRVVTIIGTKSGSRVLPDFYFFLIPAKPPHKSYWKRNVQSPI